MKSFNWGKGISLAIAIFVIATLSVVSYIISLDFYLVNNNHYEEGVNYQQTIDSRERTEALEQPVVVLYDEARIAVKVVFPVEVVENAQEGTIHLYRPNDANQDMNLSIEFDAGSTHVIPMERMEKGKWVLTINWTMNDLDYITEKVIII
jgi:nitrogen fixation protein FixH